MDSQGAPWRFFPPLQAAIEAFPLQNEEKAVPLLFQDPKVDALIERFLEFKSLCINKIYTYSWKISSHWNEGREIWRLSWQSKKGPRQYFPQSSVRHPFF